MEVAEVIWQLQAHQIVLQHQKVQRKVLNAIIDPPFLANPSFD